MNEKSVISSGGEVIVPASGETPEDISRASVVRESGIILGGDLNVIKPFKFLTPPFLALTISNGASKNQMVRRAQGKSIVHLHNSDLKQIKLFIPKINEQKKISSFFQKLDTLLVLYQRKIGLLQQLKKAMLQRLFPDTDTYPKLRFGGFSGPWEQRKLRDVIDSEIKGKAKATMLGDKSVYLETGYLNGGIKQRVNSPTNVDEDDVLILWDGSKAGKLYHGFSGALGSTLKAFKPKFSGMFLYQYMSKDQDKIYQQYRTPNIPHVVKNFTDKYLVNLPNLQEQKQIGIFFNQLDTLITLQQRKLDNMNKLKKFMLQQMFI